MTKSVHQLKITLRGVRPPVWRRIVVDSAVTLSDLAPKMEAAMGWLGSHLHAFEADGESYAMPNPEWLGDSHDETKFRLEQVLPSEGSKMQWDYDFGDGWEHDVIVEEIGPPEPDVTYPVCVKGRRAGPPEDCGGPRGYSELLEVIGNPDLDDPMELREWAPDFDPEYFDPEEATEAMRSARHFDLW